MLINGALIGSLLLVIAVGARLGGAWELLFPAWLLVLLVGAKLWLKRHPRDESRSKWRARLLVLLTAAVTGFLVGGLSLGLLAGVCAGLAVLLVLALERVQKSPAG
ncbi:MAG TPA: hypothetical protein VH420_10600 [Gaiellaceae bacterium]